MSDRKKVLSTKRGRAEVAEFLRGLASRVASGEVTAVAWTFIYAAPQEYGQINGGTTGSAGRDRVEYAELGQLVAIECEENNWQTPWNQ